jgi:hypothetical protein
MFKERSFCVDLMKQMIMIMLIIINVEIALLNPLLGYSPIIYEILTKRHRYWIRDGVAWRNEE